MTITFKEALIAHLQGEKVECRLKKDGRKLNFIDEFGNLSFYSLVNHEHDELYEFRLAPRTIFVNGVEVPAPEKVAPKNDVTYYIPMPNTKDRYEGFAWQNSLYMDQRLLADGLVYLNKEDAIARAKAMLITG